MKNKILLFLSIVSVSGFAFANSGIIAAGTLVASQVDPEQKITGADYRNGGITQKIRTYVDEERGTVCYVTYGKIRGSVPATANEGNPAISCVKL
ncbi:MAG: hypothetical protein GY760_03010 [Deltaproteobacteria bacterium]|nr:hypothetical protein [Deltaproteobacteria bacterium]